MNVFRSTCFGVVAVTAALALSTPASATTYTVDALANSISTPLDTGLVLNSADTYSFSVENALTTIWSAGAETPYSRDSTAAGIDPVASGYGQWTQNGFTANYGALVGHTTTNGYFLIGTGMIGSGYAGDLQLMYWDSYYGDNSGTQTLDVNRVPEPVTLSLFGAGLLGAAAMRRKKKRS